MEGSLLHPGFFLLAPLAIASFCFMVGVGSSDRFIDWPYLWLLFRNISPYFWAVMGVALCVGTSILGAAWWVVVRSTVQRTISSCCLGVRCVLTGA
jgi:uncharacterized membrane protein YbhN (UPF0104 family)